MNRNRAIVFPSIERYPSSALAGQAVQSYAAALCLCIAALTLARLGANAFSNTELFFDEAQYWFWSRELAFGYYSKPPLIGWIIRGATEICGEGEACIRAPSALLHAGTALLIYALGRTLYDARIGFWGGFTYATLPGVSLSSTLISTDAPLLFFVSLALYAFLKLCKTPSWLWAVLFGAALGFGLLSKYAMVYFLLCLGLVLIWLPDYRSVLKDLRFYAALAMGGAIFTPNIVWNAQNGFATLSHTANNANWSRSMLHPGEALEFIGGQFGVFGPVLFAAFLVFCFNWLRDPSLRAGASGKERLLLAFSVPVILLMVTQAFLSRAHANWAAFAYVAATVLMTAILLRQGWNRLFRASFGLHFVLFILISLGGILAGRISLPGGLDPYARVLGWKALAETAASKAREAGFQAIATDKRALAAELLYYLRNQDIPVVAIRGDGPPNDHFELTRPLTDATPRPVLVVSLSRNRGPGNKEIGFAEIPAGPAKTRKVFFYSIQGAEE